MSTVAKNLAKLADDLDSAVAAIGDVRGRERDEVLFALSRIKDAATKAIESSEKRKRRPPPTTDAGFDTEHDWSTIIVRRE
jgi:hypothetical protein